MPHWQLPNELGVLDDVNSLRNTLAMAQVSSHSNRREVRFYLPPLIVLFGRRARVHFAQGWTNAAVGCGYIMTTAHRSLACTRFSPAPKSHRTSQASLPCAGANHTSFGLSPRRCCGPVSHGFRCSTPISSSRTCLATRGTWSIANGSPSSQWCSVGVVGSSSGATIKSPKPIRQCRRNAFL